MICKVFCLSTLPSIGDFPAEQIEWQKLLALACTALEKVSGNSGGGEKEEKKNTYTST